MRDYWEHVSTTRLTINMDSPALLKRMVGPCEIVSISKKKRWAHLRPSGVSLRKHAGLIQDHWQFL